jgi:hypothetical protein
MRMNLRNLAAAAALASAGLSAANPLPWSGSVETSTRFFTGAESRAYVSFQYKTTLANEIGVRLAGSAAAIRRTRTGLGTLVTGGRELEAGIEKSFSVFQPLDGKGVSIHLYGGLSVADTAAFTGTAFTYEALVGMTDLPFKAGLYGITGDGLQMGMAGLDANSSAPDGTSFHAFLGAPLWGDNTRSTDDGSLMRRAVWSLETGRKVTISGLSWEFKAFVGNQLGLTTGLRMTPALGNQIGFGISAGVRF